MLKKVRALAEYLDINPEEIQMEPEKDTPRTEYKTGEGTFLVMNEDEALEAVIEEQEWFIDDLGIEGYTPEFQEWIYENALDQEEFETVCKEDYKVYVDDIKTEYDNKYGNRLNQECIDAGIIESTDIIQGEYQGEKDLKELYVNYLFEQIKKSYDGNFCKWYSDTFGNEDLKWFIKHNNIQLDYKAIAEEGISWDGYGHFLSTWDGKTIELEDDLMAFKQSDYDERD